MEVRWSGMNLRIAEQFYSIQGEGPHAGVPAVFLRLVGCNLVCGGRENATRDPEDFEPEDDATWVCDTIDVWREEDESLSAEELLDLWEAWGWLSRLSDGAHVVLTGGEPMIGHHQQAIQELGSRLVQRGYAPFTEVETNGTLLPQEEVWPYVNQWNVSLKLSNSGMAAEERLNAEAIEFYISVHKNRIDLDEWEADATFKFVVSREEDVDEIERIIEMYDVPDSMVSLMPAGQTRQELRERYQLVAELCKEQGWRFSPRLQVDTWGQVTGV